MSRKSGVSSLDPVLLRKQMPQRDLRKPEFSDPKAYCQYPSIFRSDEKFSGRTSGSLQESEGEKQKYLEDMRRELLHNG
jgi:hypothetical protein